MRLFSSLTRLIRLSRPSAPRQLPPLGATPQASLVAIGLLVMSAILAPSPATAQASEPNPTLPHVFLQAGIHRIKAEVADSQVERSRGLMLRQSLHPNSGMLFVFDQAAQH